MNWVGDYGELSAGFVKNWFETSGSYVFRHFEETNVRYHKIESPVVASLFFFFD